MAAGGLTIHSGATGDTLVEGEVGRLTDRGVNRTYNVDNGHAVLDLSQSGAPMTTWSGQDNARRNLWDLRFNPTIPTDFILNVGFGQGEVDLQELQPSGVDATVVFGQLIITLPEEGEFDVNADVVFGEVVLRVPKGLAVRVEGGHVFGGINVDGDFERNGNVVTTGASDPDVNVDASTVFGSVRVEEIP
jgi:hypothetical protein